MEGEYTCPKHAPHGPISAIAVSGVRAAWVTASGGVTRLVTATIVACEQQLVDRLRTGHGSFAGLDGHGGFLVYTRPGASSHVTGAHASSLAGGQALAVSADGRLAAILRTGGRVELRTRAGALVRTLHVGAADAITLRARSLVTLHGRTLRVFDRQSGLLLRTITVPAGVQRAVDVEDGVAVLAAGRTVYAVGLQSGRVAVAAQAPARVVGAHIEATGIAYGYTLAGLGRLRFVPLSSALALVGQT
jgi:hypothetical protein